MIAAIALFFALLQPVHAGDATISWEAPTSRENGEALTLDELGVYRLRMYVQGTLVHTVEIEPDANQVIVRELENFSDGALDMDMTASDLSGQESQPSNRITINTSSVSAPTILLQWGT